MSNSDPSPYTGPIGLTRREFVAGASAAGTVLLGGYLPTVAEAHKLVKRVPKRPTCVTLKDMPVEGVTSDDEGELKIWPIPPLKAAPRSAKKKHKFKASYVSVAQRKAVTGGYDGMVFVHNLDDLNDPTLPSHNTHSGNVKPEVWVAVLSADATKVLIGTNDGQIILWDLATHATMPFQFSPDAVAGLSFVPQTADARFLSTHNGVIKLWDKTLAAPIGTFSHGNSERVNAVAVSTDGAWFVSGSFDKTVRVWNAQAIPPQVPPPNPTPLYTLIGNTDVVWRVAISPGKTRVASAGEDGYVRVWTLPGPSPSHEIPVGNHGSMGVAFDGDNAVVYTGNSMDPTTAFNRQDLL